MKKFLIGCGGVCFVVIVAVVALIIFLVTKSAGLEESSKLYVDSVIPAIVTQWSPQELLDRASPELRKVVTPDQIAQYFQKLNTLLGPLQTYNGSKGHTRMTYTTQDGKRTIGEFTVSADFEKSVADIKVGLIQHDGQWQILSFHVNSEALLK